MKQRKLCVLLSILLFLTSLPAASVSAGAEELDANGCLYAGYAKTCIDPSAHPGGPITGLPMLGYGSSIDRLSEGGMDDTGDGIVDEKDGLFATCIAITDQYGKTIVYYGIDIINPSYVWVSAAKKVILEALEGNEYHIGIDDLYLSASHTHNGPDLTYGFSFSDSELAADPIAQRVKKYREWVFTQLAQAALAALNDREEVTLTKGELDVSDTIKTMNPNATANQQRMNYVRHYKTEVGGQIKYGGSNFGYTGYMDNTSFAMEPVDRMHLVQLTPKSGGKDPIVMVNWDAHVTLNSTTSTAYGRANHKKISSDWVNSLRYAMEDKGFRVAFSQSTGGNKVVQTSVPALKNPDILEGGEGRGYKYGARLAEIAVYGLENYMSAPLDTSRIRNVTASFGFQTNAPTPEEATLLTAMLAADPSTYPSGYPSLVDYLSHADTWSKRTEYYEAFPYLKSINSRYQLINAQRRMKYLTTGNASMAVGVLSIGKELCFVVAPNELADRYSATDTLDNVTDNDWDDLIDESYGRPIVMGYTNGEYGYIPHQLAYTYNQGSADYAVGSYEAQSSDFSRYSGEKLVAFYDRLLDAVSAENVRYQCVCGGKAVDGENGHVCEIVEFWPWGIEEYLPTGGNYYLTCDVVTSSQTGLSNTVLRLDLNGHNITYRIPTAQGVNAETKQSHATRVMSLSNDSHLYLTDSTSKPGTVTRDLSLLTETQKSMITNYGLLAIIYDTSRMTMFAGVLDSTDAIAGGGGCVAVYNDTTVFTMYGGLLKGGKSYNGGVLFNRGSAYLYGGEITGGRTTGTTGYPGVYSLAESGKPIGKVTVGGNVRIWDNRRANGAQINVYSSEPDKSFTIVGNFSGEVGVAIGYPAEGKVVGTVDNATVPADRLVVDNSSQYRFAIKGDQLVLVSGVLGDVDRNKIVNVDDVVTLLLHVSMPDLFKIEGDADFDGNGRVNVDDVVTLLLHVSMPDIFPLML